MGDLTGIGFNTTDVKAAVPFEAIPAGPYDAIVVDSKVSETKAGTGKYLMLTMQVLSGPYQNRKLFDRFNLQNPNASAVEISQRQLKALCEAVGFSGVLEESNVLFGKPFSVSVKAKKSTYSGEMENVIAGYKLRGGFALAAPAALAASPAPPVYAASVAPVAPVAPPEAAVDVISPPWEQAPVAPVPATVGA
jgi:hypothetical protein